MHQSILIPCSVSVLVFLLPTASHGQDGPSESDRREAIALFQGVAANWQRLKNYDVMIVKKHHQAGGVPESDAFVSHVRMIADHRLDRYLFVGAGSYETSQDRRLSAFYLDSESGEAWMRPSLEEPAVQISKRATHNLGLAISRFPDVRLVGVHAYPSQFLETPIGEFFATDFAFKNDVKIEAIGEDNLEVVETILPAGKNFRFQRRYTFENDRPVPTHLIFSLSMRDGAQQYVMNDESISWKEINGVFMPNRIQGISRTHSKAKPKNFTVTFEWLVVNDVANLPRFGVDVLSGDKRLGELLPEH